MGQYFGNIWIPFVAVFEPDATDRTTKIIRHVDSTVAPHIAEFPNPIKSLNMSGTVIPISTSDKTADDYIEDITALAERPAIDNYFVDFCKFSGFLSVSSVTPDNDASTPISRDYKVKGTFMPMRRYQPTLKVAPRVMTNDFGFTLGVDNVDCYVGIPIGSVYVSGGDSSDLSVSTNDGTLTLKKVTSSNIIKFEYPSTLVNAGEVKLFDTRGETLEDDWFQVFNPDHEFSNDIVITNGQYRAVVETSLDRITLEVYYSAGESWIEMIVLSCADVIYPHITAFDMETIEIKLKENFTIGMTRGMPVYINTGDDTLNSVTSILSGDTSTDNYIAHKMGYYVCSNESFSTFGTSLGTGKKWFYQSITPAIPAHMVMVERNLKRYLGDR